MHRSARSASAYSSETLSQKRYKFFLYYLVVFCNDNSSLMMVSYSHESTGDAFLVHRETTSQLFGYSGVYGSKGNSSCCFSFLKFSECIHPSKIYYG